MAKRRIGIITFILCICLYLIPCQVQAASTADAKEPISADKSCSLTISYCSGGITFSELPVKLYKIADVSEDYQYTLTSSFGKSNLILNGIQTVGEWNTICSTLETYIFANEVVADFNTVTDLEGKVSFEALKPGLYLSITERVMQDETTYIFDAALIALPGLSADGLWQYQVDITSKSEIIPPSENDEEIELKVLKLWKGDSGSSARPTTIEVEIFRNGTIYQTVTLSEDNHWTYTWSAKDDGSDWKVMERNIPTGYTVTIEERETSFVLTNTLNRDNPDVPKASQTGDTLNLMLWIILMIVSGSVLIILGIAGKRIGVCLLVTAIVLLFAWQWNIHTSEQKTKEYVSVIHERIPEPQGAVPEERRDNTMSTLSIEGTDFVGILELPRFKSALPVRNEWGNPAKTLCRFGGSVYDRTMQIGGTSQKGQYDFYRDISVGDSVFFTDMEGNRFSYSVTDICYEKNADKDTLEQEEASLTVFIKNVYAFEYIIVYCDVVH